MLGQVFTVKYSDCSYHIYRDRYLVKVFMGYNVSMAYLVAHGVLHTDANNLLTTAFEEAQKGMPV